MVARVVRFSAHAAMRRGTVLSEPLLRWAALACVRFDLSLSALPPLLISWHALRGSRGLGRECTISIYGDPRNRENGTMGERERRLGGFIGDRSQRNKTRKRKYETNATLRCPRIIRG